MDHQQIPIKKFNPLGKKNALFFISATLLTILTIYWYYRGDISNDGNYVLEKWSYLKSSILLSIHTLFISFTMGFYKKYEANYHPQKDSYPTFIVAFYTTYFALILFYYPGAYELGVHSDPKAMALFVVISMVQSCYFYVMLKHITEEEVNPYLPIEQLLLAAAIISFGKLTLWLGFF